jgi:hypothetical protein
MSKEKTNVEKSKKKGSRGKRGGGHYSLVHTRTLQVSSITYDASKRSDSGLGFRLVLQTKEKK